MSRGRTEVRYTRTHGWVGGTVRFTDDSRRGKAAREGGGHVVLLAGGMRQRHLQRAAAGRARRTRGRRGWDGWCGLLTFFACEELG